MAEAAYSYVAGDPDTDYALRYGRSFAWRCSSYERTISARGPYVWPADDERGHAGTCQRLQVTIAARQADWEAGQ